MTLIEGIQPLLILTSLYSMLSNHQLLVGLTHHQTLHVKVYPLLTLHARGPRLQTRHPGAPHLLKGALHLLHQLIKGKCAQRQVRQKASAHATKSKSPIPEKETPIDPSRRAFFLKMIKTQTNNVS
jgi:hypothetical protein